MIVKWVCWKLYYDFVSQSTATCVGTTVPVIITLICTIRIIKLEFNILISLRVLKDVLNANNL